MNKQFAFLVLIFLSFYSSRISAQGKDDSFYSLTRNSGWKVSKYLFTASNTDKKPVFDNVTIRFNQKDSSRFLIEIPGGNNITGQWKKQNNKMIQLSIAPVMDAEGNFNNASFNEIAGLLSWPLQKIDMQSNIMKFKIVDPIRGEAIIEFSRK